MESWAPIGRAADRSSARRQAKEDVVDHHMCIRAVVWVVLALISVTSVARGDVFTPGNLAVVQVSNSTAPGTKGYNFNVIRGAVWNGNRYWASGSGDSSTGGTR